MAERSMAKLQKEVDRLEGKHMTARDSLLSPTPKCFMVIRQQDIINSIWIAIRSLIHCSSPVALIFFFFSFLDELLVEKEKYKNVSEELDMTLNELSGY